MCLSPSRGCSLREGRHGDLLYPLGSHPCVLCPTCFCGEYKNHYIVGVLPPRWEPGGPDRTRRGVILQAEQASMPEWKSQTVADISQGLRGRHKACVRSKGRTNLASRNWLFGWGHSDRTLWNPVRTFRRQCAVLLAFKFFWVMKLSIVHCGKTRPFR